jgi:hypothetical protein
MRLQLILAQMGPQGSIATFRSKKAYPYERTSYRRPSIKVRIIRRPQNIGDFSKRISLFRRLVLG